jgi:16S rRNA (adenine1518-N6/adenine1519-N6)-dimethyltransferase
LAGQKLGQHFLISENILKRIAVAACPAVEPLIIEIGPGKGALTKHLLERADRVVALELDAGLALELPARLPDPRLEVVQGDVLAADLQAWGPAVVAGNLPYYITSPIVERILDMGPACRRAILLVQREVAQRLTARAGSRDFGYLSARTQLFAETDYLFAVPPGAFRPPPKVDSAVVRLRPRPAPVEDTRGFVTFLGHAVRQKRKTLRNNLYPVYGPIVEEWPERNERGEQLSLEQLIVLFQRLPSTKVRPATGDS